MKKIIIPFVAGIILMSCGAGEKASTGLLEKDLIAGIEGVRAKFNNIFENPKDFDQLGLKPLNDSLVYFVDALISDYPNSAELPNVLCRAGVASLNVKNSSKAIQFLSYVADSFPDHKVVPKAMYFIGRTKEVVLEDLEGAKEAYKKLYRSHPNTVWGMNARTSVELILKPTMLETPTLIEAVDTTAK